MIVVGGRFPKGKRVVKRFASEKALAQFLDKNVAFEARTVRVPAPADSKGLTLIVNK